jgi:hypothetical protein
MLAALLTAVGCTGAKMAYNLPPSQQLMEPGPGVGGPGPGVIPVPGQPSYGAMQASYVDGGGYMGGGMDGACYGPGMPGMGGAATSQISFLGEEPLTISWDVSAPGAFDSAALAVPGKQDFVQGAIYRLRVTNLPGRESVTLYPTLEVAPVTPRTDAYLAHAPIPVQFTEEDFDQVLSGNFVTKVIYLPDPEFTEIALAGVETLVSTRLDPGVDPIAEADRRGSILAILRMGNKDLSASAMQGGGMYGPGGMGGPGCITPAAYQAGRMEGYESVVGPEYQSHGGMVDGESYVDGEYYGPSEGYYAGESAGYGHGGYAGGGMPLGVATAGASPASLPPHMVPNMAPYYGMPMSGTPIGLPGPPHVPLGVPAGLQKHVMTNRTRVHLPPPTDKVALSVKQRPGLNYPRPVTHAHVDEVNRAPVQVFHGTVPGIVPSALSRTWGKLKAAGHSADCGCDQCR